MVYFISILRLVSAHGTVPDADICTYMLSLCPHRNWCLNLFIPTYCHYTSTFICVYVSSSHVCAHADIHVKPWSVFVEQLSNGTVEPWIAVYSLVLKHKNHIWPWRIEGPLNTTLSTISWLFMLILYFAGYVHTFTIFPHSHQTVPPVGMLD